MNEAWIVQYAPNHAAGGYSPEYSPYLEHHSPITLFTTYELAVQHAYQAGYHCIGIANNSDGSTMETWSHTEEGIIPSNHLLIYTSELHSSPPEPAGTKGA